MFLRVGVQISEKMLEKASCLIAVLNLKVAL